MTTLSRRYFFVRHAHASHQTLFRPRVRESGEDPLTARGERQAREAAPALASAGVTRVVSSTLLRARETASIVATGPRIAYEHAWPELDEISPQVFRASAVRRVPDWYAGILGALHMHRHLSAQRPSSHEAGLVEARIRGVLARLDELPDARIAVVTHGYWILLMSLIVPGRVRLHFLRNCTVTRVDADGEGQYRLRYFAHSIRGAS